MPTWLKLTSEDVKDQIYKLAKKGLTPSQIGTHFIFAMTRSFILNFLLLDFLEIGSATTLDIVSIVMSGYCSHWYITSSLHPLLTQV